MPLPSYIDIHLVTLEDHALQYSKKTQYSVSRTCLVVTLIVHCQSQLLACSYSCIQFIFDIQKLHGSSIIGQWLRVYIVALQAVKGPAAPILRYRSFKANEFFISNRPGGLTGKTLDSLEGGHNT